MTKALEARRFTSSFPLSLPLQVALATVAGALHVFAFAPFGIWPLQLAVLMLLFGLLQSSPSIKSHALLGWAFGFGWYAFGVSWLFTSMHRFGGMPGWLAALAVAALALLLGAFIALMMAGAAWMRARCHCSRPVMLLIVLPTLFAVADWLRGWVFTGFPWIVTGYAHTDSPLAGFAPVLGVYGLGWLAAFIAGALLLALLQMQQRTERLSLRLLLPLAVLLAGSALKTIAWTSPSGAPVSVRLLQGNVAQEMKFDIDRINDTLALYHDLILASPADLIVTPETAIPLLSRYLPADYLPRLQAFAQASGSHLVLGIPMSDGADRYANSVIGLTPTPTAYRYDKHHLVPFGEFIPPGFRWFVDLMHIPLGDFTRGSFVQPALTVKDQRVLPNICYEDLFGEQIAAQLRADPAASILLNLSNIAWFGDSIALPQHLQISRMRALETGRPMLRATNTGVTAVIRADGVVSAQLPSYSRGVLSAQVQGHAGQTPYIRYGNRVIVGLWFVLLAAVILASRKRRSAPPEDH
jgi:apolipoprotein N-acyltransferase